MPSASRAVAGRLIAVAALVGIGAVGLAVRPPVSTAAARDFTVGPTELDFPDTPVSAATPMLSVHITNVSGIAKQPSLAGGALIGRKDFVGDGQDCGVVQPGMSCAFRYHFAPTEVGDLADSTTIGVDGLTYPITLKGKGITGMTVGPTTLTFPDTLPGSTTAEQSVVLTNISSQTLKPNLAGGALIYRNDFVSDGQTCGSLAPHAACAFRYHFAPTTYGELTDRTTIGVDGLDYGITLVGRGITGIDVSPTTLPFPDTPVGQLSGIVQVTFRNITTQVLHPGIGGGSLASGHDFIYDGEDCPIFMAAGVTCHATYQFAPKSKGQHTDTATFQINGTPMVIALVGGHALPTPSPTKRPTPKPTPRSTPTSKPTTPRNSSPTPSPNATSSPTGSSSSSGPPSSSGSASSSGSDFPATSSAPTGSAGGTGLLGLGATIGPNGSPGDGAAASGNAQAATSHVPGSTAAASEDGPWLLVLVIVVLVALFGVGAYVVRQRRRA
ncbi:MAG TPA: choice-of-anchor D domain-containing protein [Candidatus Limnocylindrales bacterium]|nr:choice-of-anchor D domain-containing protein [Candidatus Limnocylindrales bacterium]